MPDVRGQPALIAIHAVAEAGLRYVIIEVKNNNVDSETVFQQSPSPGTRVDEGSVVTLMISRLAGSSSVRSSDPRPRPTAQNA